MELFVFFNITIILMRKSIICHFFWPNNQAVIATQFIKINNLQSALYCYEFQIARLNPQNLTNDNFGDIDIMIKFMKTDRRNQRDPLSSGAFRTMGKVFANSTFPADNKFRPAQFSFNHRDGDWIQVFLVANRVASYFFPIIILKF